ncbi:MAG TPA: caspase family protein, partial [Acidobacteriota bacterium]|nr:caspase family protein [Acidobacteriota bacterium]
MILAGMLPGQGAGRQTRGQGIKIKNEAGSEMMLYTESHALVIGVSEYQRGNGWPSLPGVPEDVKTVKSALEGQGFQVQVATNPTGKLLREAIATFIDEWGFASNNRLLLYFAGHGHTGKAVDDREMGYLVPADAPSPEANPAQFNRVAVS